MNLTEEEKIKLQKIADDRVAISALRKVFLYNVLYEGVTGQINFDENCFLAEGYLQLPDAQLGSSVRATAGALGFLKTSFKSLELYKTTMVEDDFRGVNLAR